MPNVNEITKFIDVEGDLRLCIFPGCNIKCNTRWNYGNIVLTACCKTHLSRRVVKDLQSEIEGG